MSTCKLNAYSGERSKFSISGFLIFGDESCQYIQFFFSGVLFGFAVVQTTRYCACCTVKAQEKTLKRISVSLLCQKLFLVVKVIYDVFGVLAIILRSQESLLLELNQLKKCAETFSIENLKLH